MARLTKIKTEFEALLSPKRDGGDNLTSPRFVALCQEDYIESDQSLDELISIIEDENHHGDIVIWDGDQVAALMRDGVVAVRYETTPPQPYRLKRPWNKRVNRRWNHETKEKGSLNGK